MDDNSRDTTTTKDDPISAYEGRPEESSSGPAADQRGTRTGRGSTPATGQGSKPDTAQPSENAAREGGGAAHERD